MVPAELKFNKCGAFLYMTEGHNSIRMPGFLVSSVKQILDFPDAGDLHHHTLEIHADSDRNYPSKDHG